MVSRQQRTPIELSTAEFRWQRKQKLQQELNKVSRGIGNGIISETVMAAAGTGGNKTIIDLEPNTASSSSSSNVQPTSSPFPVAPVVTNQKRSSNRYRHRHNHPNDALVLLDSHAPVWSLDDFDIGRRLVRIKIKR